MARLGRWYPIKPHYLRTPTWRQFDTGTGWRDGVTYDSAGATPTSFNLTAPGTVQTGDLGLILVTWVGTAGETPPTVAVASGVGNDWTSLGAAWPDTANNMGWAVLSRVNGASDSATITVTLGNGRFTTAAAGWWSGKAGVGAVGTMYDRAGTSLSTIAPTGITTAAGRTVALLFAERTAASGTTATLDAGMARLFVEGTSTTDTTSLVADLQASGTPTPTVTATYNSASGNGAGVQVELLPAPTVRSTGQFVGVGSVTSGVVPLPAGWQAGDVCYLFASGRAITGSITGPAGYSTLIASFHASSSTSSQMALFRRVLQAGDTDPTVTCTSGRLAVLSVAVKDADTTTVEDVSAASDVNGAQSTSVTAPSLTPASIADLLLCGFGYGDPTTANLAQTVTPPSGMTEVGDICTAEAAATDAGVEVASLALADTSATGVKTGTCSASVNGMGVSVAVKAITLGGGPTQVSLPDSGTAADTLAVAAAVTLPDAGAGADSLTAAVAVTLSDSGQAADSLIADAAVPLADAGTATDTASVAAALTLPDAGAGADAVQVSVPKTLPDSGAGADTLTVATAVPLAESGTGTDTASVAAALSLADAGTATDAPAIAAALTLTDAGAGSDAVQVAVPKTLTDAGAGTDTLSVAAAVPLPDAGTGTDSPAVAVAATLQDSGQATDSLTVVQGAQIVLNDAGAGTDTLSVTAAVPLAESSTGSDALAAAVQVTLADSGAGTDAMLAGQQINLADSGAGTDTLSVAAAVPLAETGTVGDQLAVQAQVPLADAGSAQDAVAVGQAKTLADSGGAADSLRVAAGLTLADLGAATDTLALTVLLTLPDAGTAADSVSTAGPPSIFPPTVALAVPVTRTVQLQVPGPATVTLTRPPATPDVITLRLPWES